MTRIELGGEGIPIPTEALPDGLVEGALTPLTFTFNEAGNFDKTQWTPFGFTIFEVFCVGAAGGRGGFGHHIFGGGTEAPWIIQGTGGGGGGGGMHYVAGLLADLSDISAIIVGQAGSHGADAPYNYNDLAINPGSPGQDGGASSFAATLCRASGGKGGKVFQATRVANPNPAEAGYYVITYRLGGDGGDGGVGGQATAGGGAAGAVSALTGGGNARGVYWGTDSGEQGFWDGAIGEGGGGGMGFFGRGFGVGSDAAWVPSLGVLNEISDNNPLARNSATEGGRGSFNYADSSKHGAKGNQPDRVWSEINPYNPRTFRAPEAGGGGGARPTPLAKYGAYADGYSPHGVVIVRIS